MSSQPQSPPPELPPPPTPPFSSQVATALRPALRAIRSGWGQAVLSAVVVLALVFLLNLLLAWLQQEALQRLFPATDVAAAAYLREGPGLLNTALLGMMPWHGVSIGFTVPIPAGDLPIGAGIEASATFPFLLGIAITGFLLYRAGKMLAARKGAAGWPSGLAGPQIAFPYAVLMLIIGILAGLDFPIPEGIPGQGPVSVTVKPSLIGAFFLPFILAAFAAGAGALSGRLVPGTRTTRLILGSMAGGWRAAWVAVALASIGFLIVAALNPDETRAYLDLFPGGGLPRLTLIVSTLLLVPNLGTGIAAAAMGGSINITNFAAVGDTCALISYMKFPGGIAEPTGGILPDCGIPIALGPAPLQYLLFLLVPLVATFAGGWLAAQRAGADDAEDGAVAGATIALPYALWLWVLALVARLGYDAAFLVGELRFWIGPGLFSTVLLALVWGIAGGALGGAFGGRKANEPGVIPGPSVSSPS